MHKTQENQLISFLQAFGIILVVIGHAFNGHEGLALHRWIYSFHMPLFMFISGYLLKYSNEQKQKTLHEISGRERREFLRKKAVRLLVPYIAISTLTIFPKYLLNAYAIHPVEISPESYLRMLAYPFENVIIPFWFLPTLFCIFVLTLLGAPAAGRLGQSIKHVPEGILILLLILHLFNPAEKVMLLNAEGVIGYLLYFGLGYYYRMRRFETKSYGYALPLFAATFALSLLLPHLPDFKGSDVVCAVNGITMSISLGQLYEKYRCRFLHHLFGASYAIYLFSWFPQVLSQQVLLGVTRLPWEAGSAIAIVSGVYIPLLLYKAIKKWKHTPAGHIVAFLTGQ